MVTIKSLLVHGLDVPLPKTGGKQRFIHIPKRGADGSPGLLELPDGLDAITLQRLRHHYDWRPTDAKNLGKDRDELADEDVADIGLLRIEVDGEPLRVGADTEDDDEEAPSAATSGRAPGPKKKKAKASAKPKATSAPKRTPGEALTAAEGAS